MKILSKSWDGGKNSGVTGYFLIEIKSLFSIVLLKFNKGSRENFHSHAFNALTWFLSGQATEYKLSGNTTKYKRKLFPKITKKDNIHKVFAEKTSWAISIRGPWDKTWLEFNPKTDKFIVLESGRKVIKEYDNIQS